MPEITFTEYEEHLAGLDEDSFVGSLAYYQFSQPAVTQDQLKQWFFELGLNDRFLPPDIRPGNAFRRATGSKAKSQYKINDHADVSLFMRKAESNNEKTVRHIVREVRDPETKDKLFYDSVGEAIYWRASRNPGGGGHSVQFNVARAKKLGLPDSEVQRIEDFISEMHDDYSFFCKHYYTQAIRDMTRDYIKYLNAIMVRSGVYFVHRSRWDEIGALTELVNERISSGCRIHTIPLIDTDYQRDMLSAAYQDEVEKEVDDLLASVAKINEKHGGKEIPPKDYAKLQEAWHDLSSRSAEYVQMFDSRQERAADALDLALDAISEMAQNLDHGS